YSINGGQAWNLLYEDPTGGVNSYNWDTTTVDDGTAYQVKVLVTGVQDLTDYKTSLAFEIDNGIDGTGPAVLGGSVHVDPQPTYSPALATLTATLTDVGRGDSNIDAAEYMIDGSSALSMDPEDGSFDSSVEDVTITFGSAYSNGDHLIEVRGHDASGNWGGWSSVIWSVVNPDPLPEVTVYDNNGQGEDGTWVGDEVITWLATDDSPLPGNPISIYYSDNAGGDWYLIAAGEANDGAYTWDTNSVLDGSEYMIRVVCTDSVPQDGSDDSDATFYIDNGPDNPVITVTSPDGGEFFQIEQLNDITWTATDADPGDVVTIGIEYCNDWPIATWIPVASGEINDEIYPWNVPVDFTTTARVRITGTDTTARTGTDTSNGDFEIGSELFLQVQASAVPPYEILNTDGFEGTIQEANTVPIPGAGSYLIGDGWITDSITTERDIAGDWTFNIFGKITGVTGAGSLRADVYSVINGFLFSSTCPEDVAGHDTYYEFSWTEVGVGSQTIPDGDRVYVEFYLDATAGGGSTQSDETLNPGFDTAAGPEWAYSGWLDTGGGNAAGAYNGGGGNPGGWVDILLTPAGAGPASEETYAGYWEQSFTTGFVPTSATLDFDWSCTAFGTGDANLNAIVFIDTASGAPSNEVWNSGAISGITGWASVAGFDVSSSVTADTTYYLKIAARDTDLARFETAREIGFDNVMVSWEEIIPVPVFTIGHDNSATPSSVCPALNLGGPPPVPIQYDIDTSDESANGWVFVSFPITATGDVETIFDDAGWGGGTTTWDRIYWYDPSDTGDHWKCYDPAYPGTQDMPISVNNKMGFWVHLGVNDNTLRVGEGFAPAGTTIDLVAGWNLVGFPSLSGTYSAGDLKADSGDGGMRIECFNDAAAYDIEVMPDGDNFQAGNAYWVFATAAYPWIVAP
ncbi:MAG: hypothetical protein KAS67_04575, partial [Thermoplasmata archaeon]|nr:hypothetical protein [Thermoplasmata archaeon]